MEGAENIQAEDWISIGEIVIGALVVLTGVVVTWITKSLGQQMERDTAFLVQEMQNKNKLLEQKIQHSNQVKFSIKSEEIKVLNDVYDKFLDWLHLIFVIDLKVNTIDNQKYKSVIYKTYNEFNKASFRLDWWFSENQELRNTIDELLDIGIKVRDHLIEILDDIEGKNFTEEELLDVKNTTLIAVKNISLEVDKKTENLKSLLSKAIDQYRKSKE